MEKAGVTVERFWPAGSSSSGRATAQGVEDDPDPHTRLRSLGQASPASPRFIFGFTFLLVAIAGFIPGVTTPFEHLEVAGTDSEAELLGIFRVSVLQNIVHLLFGVGIIAAAREKWSLAYLIGGGVAYAAIAAYGFLINQDSDVNFLPINTADNLLHTALALGLLGAGLIALTASRRRHAGA